MVAPLADSADVAASPAWQLLDDAERERARRRRRPGPFVSAHALLRSRVAAATGQLASAIRFERNCPTCGSHSHGKPTVADAPEIHISVSYSDALVAVALTRSAPVGIDLEACDATEFDGFPQVTLAPQERAAFGLLGGAALRHARARVWARKEAILKATGHGLVIDPSQVVVSGPDEEAALVAWLADPAPPPAMTVADLETSDHRHAVAVALCGRGPLTLRPLAAEAAWGEDPRRP